MRFRQGFLLVCTALVFASMLSLMINEARCVWDEDWEIHGDGWWWENSAYAAGERDEGSLDPRKYFHEVHTALDTVSGFNEILNTKIEFSSEVYNFTWENDGPLYKDEPYSYWCRRVDTKIWGHFHNWFTGADWRDFAFASVANRGYPE
jgi:hypothetical protein